jgi:hypothetical protein
MSEKKSAKPAKKLFKSADVKDLYRHIEHGDTPSKARIKRHFATGSFRRLQSQRGPLPKTINVTI